MRGENVSLLALMPPASESFVGASVVSFLCLLSALSFSWFLITEYGVILLLCTRACPARGPHTWSCRGTRVQDLGCWRRRSARHGAPAPARCQSTSSHLQGGQGQCFTVIIHTRNLHTHLRVTSSLVVSILNVDLKHYIFYIGLLFELPGLRFEFESANIRNI